MKQQKGQSYYFAVFGFAAWLATGLGASAEDKARAAFDAGVKAFAASNYATALGLFEEAVNAAPAENLDPAIASHNARLAATKAKKLEKAADLANPQKFAKEFYNAGNIEFQLAGGPPGNSTNRSSPPKPEEQETHINKAIERYERAIELDPSHLKAKVNYELAVLKQQEMQQQKQQQQQQKDQQNQDEMKEDQKDSSQDQQQQDQQNQEQKKPDQQQQEQQKQDQQQAKEQDSKKEQAKEAQPEKPSEEMTPEEAAMMLDAMKAQEQSQRDQLHPFFGRPVPVEKDW